MQQLDFKLLANVIMEHLHEDIKKNIASVQVTREGSPEYLVVYLYPKQIFFPIDLFPEGKWNEDGFYLEVDDSFEPAGISLESILSDEGEEMSKEEAIRCSINYASRVNKCFSGIGRK